jgi:hypothetical protein
MMNDVFKAEGGFRVRAVRAGFGDSGPVRCGETRRTKSDGTRKREPCLAQGNLGTQIWTPCDTPRHNTTASRGFKYE